MNYPPGLRPPLRGTIPYICECCGNEWQVDGVMDLGDFRPYNEEDEFCPQCGVCHE